MLVLFRAGARGDDDISEIVRRSREDPGRFNTTEFGAIYVSYDETTALRELRRTTEESGDSIVDADPCSILVVEATISRVLDLTSAEEMKRRGLTREDVQSDDVSACQRAATEAVAEGFEAIVWDSAARAGGKSMAIFAERLGVESAIAVVREKPVSRELLAEIAAEANPPAGGIP
jgi:RES domain-containing protein